MTENLRTAAHERLWLALVLLTYAVLAIAYSLINPVFESPDEIHHYAYADYLARNHRLPVAQLGGPASEFHQPPLYYLIGSVVIEATHPLLGQTANLLEPYTAVQRNPFWGWRIGEVGIDNKNQYLPSPDDVFPFQNWAWCLHAIRALSIALQALTILATYLIGREVFPSQPAIRFGSLAFVAFLPQFLFIAGSVSNDNLAIPLAALLTWLLMRGLRTGLSTSWSVAVGLLVGASVATKMSGLALVPLSLAVTLLIGWRSRAWNKLVGTLALVIGLTALLSGPVMVRNLHLYGEPTALRRMSQIWGQHDPPLTYIQALREVPNIWTSYWARFGYGQIPLPNPVYFAAAVLAALAVLGLVLWLVKNSRNMSKLLQWQLLVLLVISALFAFLVLNYVRVSLTGSNGRFTFPALPTYATLLFLGLSGWFAPRYHRALVLTAHIGMIAFALLALVFYLRPAYQPSTMLDTLPKPAHPIELRFGDQAMLHGYDLDRDVIYPGEDLTVTLYWQALRPIDTNYAVFVHLIGPGGELLGARDTYPGLGRMPTSSWRSGGYLLDPIRVPVNSNADSIAPAAVTVEAGLYHLPTMKRLPITDSIGQEVAVPGIGRVKLAATSQPDFRPAVEERHNFGNEIALLGYDLPGTARPGETVALTLYWQPLSQPTQDYTVFIHILDKTGTLVAQYDAPPQGGAYPTSLWSPPETLADHHAIMLPDALPAGEYRIDFGLYNLLDGSRLPTMNADGQTLSDHVIIPSFRLDP